MKVSLHWLREFVELPPTTEELVELLTLAGVEVEGVVIRGVDVPNVVVAEVRESVQHPNADRLSVCQVDDGSGALRQIVCGAKNYQVGDKVPLALPGAVLPGDFKIKVGKLRGVESQGMLCSSKELALADDAEGLLILPESARVGAPIAELFPSDTILDLEVTPNRSDLLSHYGIAREIGALTKKNVQAPKVRVTGPVADREDVEISTPNCWLYSVRKIEGVKVGPSPEWLRCKLEGIGLRAINNVVDITNYVMMELGQPLHAFDAARVRGNLQVRAAQSGEAFLALDDKTYTLADADIVIADEERTVALGGVMGGKDSAVVETTRDVWLEAADFQPQSIRRTSRRLGLVSDSSYRFERGIDFDAVLFASQRATELIVEVAGGQSVAPLHSGYSPPFCDPREPLEGDIAFGDTPSDRTVMSIELRPERVAHLLGIRVSDTQIHDILTRLGLIRENGKWGVPSFRPDLTREVDLIEEIARVLGMDVIPSRVQARFAPASASDRAYDEGMDLRRAFAAHGLHEARNVTLVPANPRGLAMTQTAPGSLLRVRNPMIDDQVVLRPNLLHGLLEAVATNVRAGAKSIHLFELGRVFSAATSHEETFHGAIVLTGPLSERTWREGEGRDTDLFDLKGILTAALGGSASFESEENPALALSLLVKVGEKPVGFAGQLWPADARALGAAAPVFFAELDLDAVGGASPGVRAKKYHDVPRFPAVTRDIAMVAPLTLSHATIMAAVERANEPLLANVELFDLFTDPTGAKIPADRRSLAYSLTYRSPERTLTADEVNAAHARLKERLTRELGVTLRE